ncbi:MAG: DUF459 domain-containing protein [Verrucomicrobia bacterium]|nr:DUF459 domain-containing protein [Verrucomicrobiota bacterium]MCH8525977.1 DUF459 domain-containing protein [Kiritimatiellia bacterium]
MKIMLKKLFVAGVIFSTLLLKVSAEADASKRVLLIGDSMMRVPAHAAELQLRRLGGVESMAYSSLGSGLARLDVFDWIAKIDELIEEFSPDVTIAWFGANDHQPLQVDGRILRTDDEAWGVEYSRRVGEMMDKLTAKPGSKVYWMEIPDMRDPGMQAKIEEVNVLLKQEADKREQVVFFETRRVLSRRPGTYTSHMPGPTGMPLMVRDADGVHLNRAGADRISEHLIQAIFQSGSGR